MQTTVMIALHQNTTQTFFKKFLTNKIQLSNTPQNMKTKINFKFFDINITKTINNKYEFNVHHKQGHYQRTYQKVLKNLIIKYNYELNNKSNHENNTENRDYKNLEKLPWIPNISAKIKREFKKIGKDIAFTLGKNLQQILCQNTNQKYYQMVNQEYITQVARAI